MRQAAVDEVHALHAFGQGADGARDFRAHALVDDPAFLQRLDVTHAERGDERIGILRIGEQAGHVAHVDEAASAERAGDATGDGVGIHIVGFAVVAFGHRRNHRHESVGDFLLDELHLHLGDIAHETEVARVAVVVDGELLTDEHAVTRQALRPRPDGGEHVAHVFVHDLVERLLDDRDGGLIGDAETVDKIRLKTGSVHRAADGLAAPVHDNDVDADGGEEREVGGDAHADRRVRVVHEAAAVFHDESGAAKILNVRQRLEEDAGFGDDLLHIHREGGG